MKKQKCYNCAHAGKPFKINLLTHVHCYKPEYLETKPTAWETLRVFNDGCETHKSKE